MSNLQSKLMAMTNSLFHAKVYEPRKRWCGGSYGWVAHRFPVKGGISWRDVMASEQFAPNPLLKMIRLKEKNDE